MKKPNLKVFFVLLTLFAASPAFAGTARQSAVVDTVLSGDTVRLKGGKELRYASIESPPTTSSIALMQEYGQAALEFNRKLVEGKTISIEWGPQLRDKKNHLLGYVFLEDETFVNRQIIQNGHAKARIVPPNLRYAEDFRKDELAAHRNRKGLWLKEPEDPKLSSDLWGDKVRKIYYYPNSPELDDVPQTQLVKFRSRIEAKAAGYDPCHSCRNQAALSEDTET